MREQKLRVEMMQAKKENAHFLQLVDQKKAIEGMEARKVREPLEYGARKGLAVEKQATGYSAR